MSACWQWTVVVPTRDWSSVWWTETSGAGKRGEDRESTSLCSSVNQAPPWLLVWFCPVGDTGDGFVASGPHAPPLRAARRQNDRRTIDGK